MNDIIRALEWTINKAIEESNKQSQPAPDTAPVPPGEVPASPSSKTAEEPPPDTAPVATDEAPASPSSTTVEEPQVTRAQQPSGAPVPPPRDEQTASVQQQLINLGFDPGPADGVYGARTRAAIQAFQVQEGLPPDGQVSSGLSLALEQALSDSTTLTTVVPQAGPSQAVSEDIEVSEGVESDDPAYEDETKVAEAARTHDPTAALLQALIDFRSAVVQAIDGNISVAALALWDGHALESGPGPPDLLSSTLAIAEAASPEATSGAAGNGPTAGLSEAKNGLGLIASTVGYLTSRGQVERTRTMLEVAALYPTAADYQMAIQLYILGSRDLASPLSLPNALAGTVSEGNVDWGAEPLRQAVLTKIDPLVEGLSRGEWRPHVALDVATERLREEIISVSATSMGRLNELRRQIVVMAVQDGPLTQTVRLKPDFSSSNRTAVVEIGYALSDGRAVGQVSLTFVLADASQVADFSQTFATTARAQTIELAYLMLWSLPAELLTVSRTVADVEAYLRGQEVQPVPVAVPAKPMSAPSPQTEAAAGTGTFPAAPAANQPTAVIASAPTIEIALKDGSVLRATIFSGSVSYATALGQLTIAAEDIASLGEQGLQLADGTLLKGKVVGGQLALDTDSGQRTISAGDIASIATQDHPPAVSEPSQ